MKLGFHKRKKLPSFAPRSPKKSLLEKLIWTGSLLSSIDVMIEFADYIIAKIKEMFF